MSTQTPNRVVEGPLSVVVRPGSEAAAAYRSAVLAPGFGPEPGLDLRYFGGRTLPDLSYSLVYLEGWPADRRTELDRALAAAMGDQDLNNVLAQYFPSAQVTATFAGSLVHPGPVPDRVDRAWVETLAGQLDGGPTVTCIVLPPGAVLADGDVDSQHGLGGYHGSVKAGTSEGYYSVSVYSDGDNGIVAFDEPWKNVCATLYHELQETRTDPDVEDAIRQGSAPGADKLLGWYSPRGGEIGDIPMSETNGDIGLVMKEVPLADGSGTVPIQLMWSNAVDGPEGPIAEPHPPQ